LSSPEFQRFFVRIRSVYAVCVCVCVFGMMMACLRKLFTRRRRLRTLREPTEGITYDLFVRFHHNFSTIRSFVHTHTRTHTLLPRIITTRPAGDGNKKFRLRITFSHGDGVFLFSYGIRNIPPSLPSIVVNTARKSDFSVRPART